MTLVGPKRTTDPLRNLPAGAPGLPARTYDARTHPAYTRRRDDTPPSMARQLVIDFLRARLAANNARMEFLLDPSPENMTAWATAENNALGDTE